jgi:hypothetical protein
MKIRRSPGTKSRATSTPPSDNADSTHGTDITVDLALVGANSDIWALLFDGKFRLAVKCDVCGRWLTAGASKAAGRGPHCAARAVG